MPVDKHGLIGKAKTNARFVIRALVAVGISRDCRIYFPSQYREVP